MKHSLITTWNEMIRPLIWAPRVPQVGTLCVRTQNGKTEVLLITSRDTGRWIIPKGWPMKDRDDADAALQEAWEEAGVKASLADGDPVGKYDYDKRKDDDVFVPVTVSVYRADVETLASDFPEADERTRRWVSPQQAACMVDEPQLKALLRSL